MKEQEIPEGASDKKPAAATKPTSNIIKENCIHIFVEGGVVQDVIGIPKGEEIIIVDWDSEGVEPKNLTELEAGPAIVSIYRGESLHPDQVVDIDKLIEYMKHRDSLECYIDLGRGYKTSVTIIKPDSDAENITVFNELDGTEDEYKSLDAMAATHPGIHEALFMNKFYVYGYELGGC